MAREFELDLEQLELNAAATFRRFAEEQVGPLDEGGLWDRLDQAERKLGWYNKKPTQTPPPGKNSPLIPEYYSYADLKYHVPTMTVFMGKKPPLRLYSTQGIALYSLLRIPERTVPHQEFAELLHDPVLTVETLNGTIERLRTNLNDKPLDDELLDILGVRKLPPALPHIYGLIQTVRGVGYRLELSESVIERIKDNPQSRY
jgi:DNA-binding response OmpR family regulator